MRHSDAACADAGVELEQYAENIGMVRRTVQSIAGPRTFDLVYARVGNQTVAPARFGRFTVTAEPAPNRTELNVAPRLETGEGPPLTLRFPSAQEYDLRVRDASGRILWTWSADKLFAQAAHELTVNREWSVTVTAPRPENLTEFFIEGWLTAAQSAPMFAAMAPVSTP